MSGSSASLLLLVCGLVGLGVGVAAEDCESGRYTWTGVCCLPCSPGEGVVKKCGATQTQCSLCLDSETFSENESLDEECSTCTECVGLMRMATPCTDSSDATCVCDYSYFMSDVTGMCQLCTVCPAGQGVLAHCADERDTVCEPCLDDTYSDRDSSLDPCLPCTMCEEGVERELAPCTPLADSVCHNPLYPSYLPPTYDPAVSFPTYSDMFPPADDSSSPSPAESTTAGPGSPRFLGHGFNENLIPVYCSILAAVVVGLVAYIVFKRWNSCKQNKQPANSRAVPANQTAPPEGEKMHSDSGISVDSQSLQEQQAQAHHASRSHTQEQIVV